MSKKGKNAGPPEGVAVESGLEATIRQEGKLECQKCWEPIGDGEKPFGYYPREYALDENRPYSGFLHPKECTDAVPPGMVGERMTKTAAELTEIIKVRIGSDHDPDAREVLSALVEDLPQYATTLGKVVKVVVEYGVVGAFAMPSIVRQVNDIGKDSNTPKEVKDSIGCLIAPYGMLYPLLYLMTLATFTGTAEGVPSAEFGRDMWDVFTVMGATNAFSLVYEGIRATYLKKRGELSERITESESANREIEDGTALQQSLPDLTTYDTRDRAPTDQQRETQ